MTKTTHEQLNEMIKGAVTTTSWPDGKKDKFIGDLYSFLLGLYANEKENFIKILNDFLRPDDRVELTALKKAHANINMLKTEYQREARKYRKELAARGVTHDSEFITLNK